MLFFLDFLYLLTTGREEEGEGLTGLLSKCFYSLNTEEGEGPYSRAFSLNTGRQLLSSDYGYVILIQGLTHSFYKICVFPCITTLLNLGRLIAIPAFNHNSRFWQPGKWRIFW